MKDKRLIARLEEERRTLVIPLPDTTWRNWCATLREVVSNNIGYSEAKTLSWDRDGQNFYLEVEAGMRVGPFYGTMAHTVVFDPRKPLLEELERVHAEVEAFKTACVGAVCRAEAMDEAAKAKP